MAEEIKIQGLDDKQVSTAVKAVTDGHTKGLDEDEILMNLVKAKIPVSKSINVYKKLSEKLGFVKSAKEINEEVTSEVDAAELTAGMDWDSLVDIVDGIMDVTGATRAKVSRAVRKRADEEEIELPSKPKGAPSKTGRMGKLNSNILDLFVGSPSTTKQEMYDYLIDNDLVKGPDNAVYYVKSLFTLCHGLVNGKTTEVAVEDTKNMEFQVSTPSED